LLSYLSS